MVSKTTTFLTIGVLAGLVAAVLPFVYGDTPLFAVNKLTGETQEVTTQFDTSPHNNNTLYLNGSPEVFDINEACVLKEPHSNFTENIWNKFCIDPQSDEDYNGTNN